MDGDAKAAGSWAGGCREDGCCPEGGRCRGALYSQAGGYCREVFAAERAGRKAAVPDAAAAGAGQAVPGALAQGAPADVLQGVKVARDVRDVPVRKLPGKYLLPGTGCLCVRFLNARWTVCSFACY